MKTARRHESVRTDATSTSMPVMATRYATDARPATTSPPRAGLIEFSLQHLVGRPRPGAALASAGLLGPSFAPDIDSFPSGHATSVFAVATVFAAYYPRLRWPLYALAAAIALGRVYLARHYVSDIIAGAALGAIVAACLYRYRQTLPGGITLERSADRSH